MQQRACAYRASVRRWSLSGSATRLRTCFFGCAGGARSPRTFDSPRRERDTERVATANDELVRSSFDAFLRGDWDALARPWTGGRVAVAPARRLGLPRPPEGAATLFERQREGVVTGLNEVVAVDERVFVEVTGPSRSSGAARRPGVHGRDHP